MLLHDAAVENSDCGSQSDFQFQLALATIEGAVRFAPVILKLRASRLRRARENAEQPLCE